MRAECRVSIEAIAEVVNFSAEQNFDLYSFRHDPLQRFHGPLKRFYVNKIR